jgi:OOP family OmpA-OmpF porin
MRVLWIVIPFLAAGLGACAASTVQQTGFAPIAVTATPPAPPPPPPPPPPPEPVVEKIDIPDKVQFEVAKAKLKPASHKVLDHVVKVMTSRPGIKKVRIEGHTDSTGDAAKNRMLSKQRAESVLEYLVKKGIARARLEAMGHGPDKPIGPNDSEAGREANRRVEFTIVEQDATPAAK